MTEMTTESEVCSTCLSRNRKLFSLNTLSEDFSVFCDVIIPNGGICWECKAILQKLVSFREKAKKAQQMLLVTSNSPWFSMVASLSNLTVSTVEVANCSSDKELLEEGQEKVFIKQEDYDITDSIQNEGKDDSLIKEEFDFNDIDISENSFADEMNNLCDSNKDNNKEDKENERYKIVKLSDEEMRFRWEKRFENSRYQSAKYRCESCAFVFANDKNLESHRKLWHSENHPESCNVCLQRFENATLRDHHYRSHHIILVCTECGKESDDFVKANDHYKKNHAWNKKCTKCDIVFNDFKEHATHMRRHFSKVTCKYCGKRYSKGNITRHMMQHNGGLQKVKCDICNVLCKGGDRLRQHKRMVHSELTDAAYCAECGIQYKNIESYRMHLKQSVKHNTELKYECRHCGKKFSTATRLKGHEEIHGDAEKYTCEICNKSFKAQHSLRAHARYRHPKVPKVRDKVCNVCSKAFFLKKTLEIHMNTHTGARPFSCDYCSASFNNSGSFSTHVKRVHLNIRRTKKNNQLQNKEAAFCAECGIQYKSVLVYKLHLKQSLKHNSVEDLKHACPHCDKRFGTATRLKFHLGVHADSYNFTCDICSKGFKVASTLRSHKRNVHSNKERVRDKVCNICSKAFYLSKTLENHMNVHTGARPFHCEECGATFGNSGSLYTHRKQVHKRAKRRDNPSGFNKPF